jgi:hypothetical protein
MKTARAVLEQVFYLHPHPAETLWHQAKPARIVTRPIMQQVEKSTVSASLSPTTKTLKNQPRLFGCAHCNFSGTADEFREHRRVSHGCLSRGLKGRTQPSTPGRQKTTVPVARPQMRVQSSKPRIHSEARVVYHDGPEEAQDSSILRDRLIALDIITPAREDAGLRAYPVGHRHELYHLPTFSDLKCSISEWCYRCWRKPRSGRRG